jgi:AhpD family alkylhydroperoxidase
VIISEARAEIIERITLQSTTIAAHGHMKERLDEFGALVARLGKEYPSQINSFMNFMKRAEEGPALSMKYKELINVALGVAAQCEWCIAFHVQAAASAGATREEVMEAGFMAVLMHGGPALAHLKPLVDSIDEFITEK